MSKTYLKKLIPALQHCSTVLRLRQFADAFLATLGVRRYIGRLARFYEAMN